MSAIQAAIVLSIVNYILTLLDNNMAWDATWRPLVVGWVTGLALGDQRTGLVMGAELEAVYMGISAIGGVIPSDPEAGTLIPVAAVILSGVDKSAALALAVPVGTLINYANTLMSPIQLAFLGLYDKYAAEDNQKAYIRLHYWYMFVITPLPRTLIIFLAVWLGVGNLGGISDSMPIWLINGLDVASGMLVAVGFGILTSMIWSKKLGIFFFVGFVLSELMGLSTIGTAVFALAIAISVFLVESGINKVREEALTSTASPTSPETKNQEEDSLF